MTVKIRLIIVNTALGLKWRPSNLSELTSMVFNMELTHLGSEASKYYQMVFVITFMKLQK